SGAKPGPAGSPSTRRKASLRKAAATCPRSSRTIGEPRDPLSPPRWACRAAAASSAAPAQAMATSSAGSRDGRFPGAPPTQSISSPAGSLTSPFSAGSALSAAHASPSRPGHSSPVTGSFSPQARLGDQAGGGDGDLAGIARGRGPHRLVRVGARPQVGEHEPPGPGLAGHRAGLPGAGQVLGRAALHLPRIGGLGQEEAGAVGEFG